MGWEGKIGVWHIGGEVAWSYHLSATNAIPATVQDEKSDVVCVGFVRFEIF